MSEPSENEKKALAAGVAVGVGLTFLALIKAAVDQVAKANEDTKE